MGETMRRNNCRRIEQYLCSLVNQSRKKSGIRKYRMNRNLSNFAKDHSKRMANSRNIFHDPNAGFENVAYIFNPGASDWQLASQFHRQWMGSPGHRSNILNNNNDTIGIGVVQRGSHFYATQKFTKSGITMNYTGSIIQEIYDAVIRPINRILSR
jgi:uncharacterized protein YkwD